MNPSPSEEAVVITYLEMLAPPARAARSLPEGAYVMQAHHPTVAFYRFLYNTVGAPWQWGDRNRIAPEVLAEMIQHPDVEVHVLYLEGTPAGYVELDRQRAGEVQVVYFGLMPSFIGRGLGVAFLEWAVQQAWASSPYRVWVHTCTRDHPRALALYRKVGFVPYRQESQVAS